MLNRLGIVIHTQRNHLSGGEELRVALARALIGPAQVIFADEPTGSLDPKLSHDVMRLFKEVVRTEGKSVLLVTHDTQLAHQFGDKVFEMGRSGLMPLSPNDPRSHPSAAEGGQA
jgi:putative ABC transport system ATP-binding protein